MRREARRLADKACESLLISIELFNRPIDKGRTESGLILMDRSLELLLKSAIVHRGGTIWRKDTSETIDFSRAIRIARDNSDVRFLSPAESTILLHLHSQRNAAQHHLSDVSEGLLYTIMQTSMTVFRSVFEGVLGRRLADYLPSRVLPISTTPLIDIQALFDNDLSEIQNLLSPGRRQRAQAEAKLAPWMVLDEVMQTSDLPSAITRTTLKRSADRLAAGEQAIGVLPRASSVVLDGSFGAVDIALKLTKRDGVPIHVVEDDDESGLPVVVKPVNELGRYPFGKTGVHRELQTFWPDLTAPKAFAAIRLADLDDDKSCSTVLEIDKSKFRRYSMRAVTKVRDLIEDRGIEAIWQWDTDRRQANKELKRASGR